MQREHFTPTLPISYAPPNEGEPSGRQITMDPEENQNRIKQIEATDPGYIPVSSLESYLKSSRGLAMVFNYVERIGLPKKVLDIGTGDGNALKELAEARQDFSYIGTVLSASEQKNLVPENMEIKEATAETLLPIEDESIGAILSFQAIGFSAHPEAVAESMDRVLMPGGIIKASFRKKHGSYGKEWNRKYDEWGYNSHDQFTFELHQRGYDIAILETEGDDVILAIKPDRNNHSEEEHPWNRVEAWQLLSIDNIAYLTRDNPVEVFGKEALEQTKGNEATAEDAEKLKQAVLALCNEKTNKEQMRGRYEVTIRRGKTDPIVLTHNPSGLTGFGDSVADIQPISVQGYKTQRRLQKPRGYLFPGMFKTSDSLYVDSSGKAKLRRCISYDGRLARRTRPSITATKDATKKEVNEALMIVRKQ